LTSASPADGEWWSKRLSNGVLLDVTVPTKS
jgi:hypothetical protein